MADNEKNALDHVCLHTERTSLTTYSTQQAPCKQDENINTRKHQKNVCHLCTSSWWNPSSHRKPRGKKEREGTAVKSALGKELRTTPGATRTYVCKGKQTRAGGQPVVTCRGAEFAGRSWIHMFEFCWK